MKQTKIYLFAVLTLVSTMFASCAEDDTMTQIESTQENQQKAEEDEVIKALKAIPGISNVELRYSTPGADDDVSTFQKDSAYFFFFEQPIDYAHPERGSYYQYARLYFEGFDKNVVVLTDGYNMDETAFGREHLTQHLKANQLEIEHRYFGQSLPENFEDLAFTYLNADQQAHDIHAILSALKTNLFKNSKFVSTGTSKDGITTALQAYYSSLYGWKDIDCYVPFCAPFLPGFTFSDGSFTSEDPRTAIYLVTTCGNNYEKGSQEAIAYERLKYTPYYIWTNTKVRSAVIEDLLINHPSDYARIVNQYETDTKREFSTGDKDKDLAAYAINLFYEALFTKFSYVPYSRWASLVPDPAPIANGTATKEEIAAFTEFVFMDDKTLGNKLHSLTRGVMEDEAEQLWFTLLSRRQDPTFPYYVQGFRELGLAGDYYGYVDGTAATAQQCANVNAKNTWQWKYSGIYKQDKGQLMTDFLKWVETETTEPIIFVYAYNDPWTGGSIPDAVAEKNPMIEKLVDGIAVHNPYFLDKDSYEERTKNAIIAALEKFLK